MNEPSRIFAAEVRGKRVTAEIGEDEIASRILGIFAHLSTDAQTSFLTTLQLADGFECSSIDVILWPRLANLEEARELDAIIATAGKRIAFEFKWESPGNAHQLVSERTLLDPDDTFVYVTKHMVEPPEVERARSKLPADQVFHWVPWRRWLRAAVAARTEAGDSRDAHLLDDMIGFMEVLGMTDWQSGLEQYWRVSADRTTTEAFQGLGQFFKELRTRLKDKHGERHWVGEAQTVFAYKSWVELTPLAIQGFAENLAVYVVLNHVDQSWEFTLELKGSPLESAVLARDKVKDLGLDDIEVAEGSVVARRPFTPTSTFRDPPGLIQEIEDGLVRFAQDISPAFSRQ